MRKTLFLFIACFLALGQTCFAISLADAEKTVTVGYGSTTGDAHAHVSTRPIRIYSVTMTVIAGGGFAQLIETKGPYDTSSGVATEGELGKVFVSEGTVKADPQSAVANDTVHLTWENGLAIGDQLFVDCQAARVVISYRE